MTGTLLISLDCEGKWGMADDPSMLGSHRITDESLRWAYWRLFSLLEQNGLRATFAVVGLFVAGQESTRAHFQEVASSATGRDWSTIPMKVLESRSTDGWFFKNFQDWSCSPVNMSWHPMGIRTYHSPHGALPKNWRTTNSQQCRNFLMCTL